MDLVDFERERPRLFACAAGILGSDADADDVLQEARLRFMNTDEVDDGAAWLTTVVTRLCIDHLRRRARRSRTEAAAQGDPTVLDLDGADPETDVLLSERVGGAMQVVLDVLTPAERVTLVLHDVFGYRFDEVGEILGRSPTAVRQLGSRARRKVQGVPEPAERVANERVVDAFLTAARGGDLVTLLSLLDPDATMRADLAGQRMGTDSEYAGAAAVAARFNGAKGAAPVTIDGDLAAAWIAAGEVKVAFVFHLEAGRIREVELIADPDVLATMDVARATRKRRRGSRLPAASNEDQSQTEQSSEPVSEENLP